MHSSSLGPKLEEAVDAWDHLAGIDLHGLKSFQLKNGQYPSGEKLLTEA